MRGRCGGVLSCLAGRQGLVTFFDKKKSNSKGSRKEQNVAIKRKFEVPPTDFIPKKYVLLGIT
jgi:hypothetical protein